MSSFIVQAITFLLIAFTPISSWFVAPLYLAINCILAFVSFIALISTSKQVGNRLEVESASFAGCLFQFWFWTNIVFAIPSICMIGLFFVVYV